MINDIPEVQIKNRQFSISAIWIIPLVAALIGGWLVFKSAIKDNVFVEVSFESASGLEAGKTIVKLRNVKVGEVRDVKFSDDLSRVIVVMEFTGMSRERITDTARFWVVRPRIDISGVSGLDTLLSGAYIEIDPGEAGLVADKFTGFEEPQNYQLGNPGTSFLLRADNLGSLVRGSPIQFKGIDVGMVTRYALAEDHSHVQIEIFIRAPHDEYVRENTRFWNTSGFEIELGAKGLKLDTNSLTSIITGGITFSNSESENGRKAAEKTKFKLNKTAIPDIREALTYGAQMKLYFDDGVSGLSVGAPVEYKGLRLGTVTEVSVESDKNKSDILTYATIEIEPERLPTQNFNLELTKEERINEVYLYFKNMIKLGLRAQLKSNLITGQSLITLDMFPEMEKNSAKYKDGIFILPTAPETFSGLLDQVNKIIAKINAMPLNDIGNNLNDATKNTNSLIKSLDTATININRLMKSLDAAQGGMTGVQAGEMMDELTRAARSIRSMADYLERHPESLLKGKK